MFITGGQGYYTKDGQQKSRSGDFLILVSAEELPLDKDNFRACVVKTHLEQCGCWMMGSCVIQGRKFTLSGGLRGGRSDDDCSEGCL